MATTLLSFLSFYGKTDTSLQSSGDLTKMANYLMGVKNPIVALAGGAQAGSPVLGYADNEITTVATTNDSVQLPPAIPGASIIVINSGANTARIYAGIAPNLANAGVVDQIVANATVTKTANGTAITLASGFALLFGCTTIGIWKQLAVAS